MTANDDSPANIPRGPSTKRLSLPTGPTKKHATLPPRKSLSPRHSQSRALTGSLLSQPVTNQFHALKDRNASAVASLATEKAARATEMLRATKRIEALEKSLEGARIECEGWESETVRMAAELEGLTSDTTRTSAMESELERVREEGKGWKEEATREKEKKVRAKALASRLRLELVGRRLKEKWELGVMDREDRERDAIATTLEYEIAIARMQAGLDTIFREELEVSSHIRGREIGTDERSRKRLEFKREDFRNWKLRVRSYSTLTRLRKSLSTLSARMRSTHARFLRNSSANFPSLKLLTRPLRWNWRRRGRG